MYTEAPITPDILRIVLGNLWERGAEELRRLGMSADECLARFWWYAQTGKSGALLADGLPVMVAGIHEDGSEAFTWFQATDDFDQHAVAITRVLRRRIKEYPGSVFIYSVCCHEKTERWFKALGMRPDGWTALTTKGYPLRRFARN